MWPYVACFVKERNKKRLRENTRFKFKILIYVLPLFIMSAFRMPAILKVSYSEG